MLCSKSVIAVPPGETIREQLEIRGMSQREFAQRMSLTEKHISRLINGKVELTQEVSLRLETVLGVPASFWNNLEAVYREHLARASVENEMDEDIAIAKKFPYAEIAKFGWVATTRKAEEKVENLRKFFEVARLGALDDLKVPGIAYRKAGKGIKSDYALAVWAQKARLEARTVDAAPINIARLKEAIPAIKALTTDEPNVFCPELQRILAACGVVIVFLPHIGGSFLHGASFIDGNHIVLGLTVRGRDADRFWFSLFHELYHILAGHILVTATEENVLLNQEWQADQFARDTLISPEDYKRFLSRRHLNKTAIIKFAAEIGVAPGIVLGRLQKENIVSYKYYNELKSQYVISA